MHIISQSNTHMLTVEIKIPLMFSAHPAFFWVPVNNAGLLTPPPVSFIPTSVKFFPATFTPFVMQSTTYALTSNTANKLRHCT